MELENSELRFRAVWSSCFNRVLMEDKRTLKVCSVKWSNSGKGVLMNQIVRKCLPVGPKKVWLLPLVIGMGGFYLGTKIGEPLFGPKKLCMYLCVFSVIRGWASTCRTNSLSPHYEKLLAAYSMSEGTGHLVRLLVISLFGALTTASLLIGMSVGREMPVVSEESLSYLTLGHFISTAIGGLGAIMGVSFDGNELVLSILSWFGFVELSHRMETAVPLPLMFLFTAVLLAIVSVLMLTASRHNNEWEAVD
jgi:hypothetical protein